MKKTQKIVVSALFVLGLLLSHTLVYVLAQTPSQTTVLGVGSLTETADFIAFSDSGYFFGKNGTTGQIEYSSTSGTRLLTNIQGNNTSGVSIYIKGTIPIRFLNLTDNLTLFGSGVEESKLILTAGDMEVHLLYGSSKQNITIHDIALDGNYSGLTGSCDGNPVWPALLKLETCNNVNIYNVDLLHAPWFGIDSLDGDYLDVRNIYSYGGRCDALALNNMDYVIVDGLNAKNWTDSGDAGSAGLWISSRDVVAERIHVSSYPCGVRVEGYDHDVYRVAVNDIVVKDGDRVGLDISRKNDASVDVWGVTVSDFVITDYNIGVRIERENDPVDSTLHNVALSNGYIYNMDGTAYADYEHGIWVYNMSSLSLANIQIHNPDDTGIYLESSYKIDMVGVSVQGATDGLILENADWVQYSTGFLFDNSNDGMHGDANSGYNIFSNLNAYGNSNLDLNWVNLPATTIVTDSYNSTTWVSEYHN